MTARLEERALVDTLIEPLRRIVTARVGDPHTADDVVQETLLKVLGARDRVADDALLPYAVVTARNLLNSDARRAATARRHAPRLVDLDPPPSPDEAVLRREEDAAVQVALRTLSDADRKALVAHEVHGVDTATLARSASTTSGGVAAQLARARARMRVEYLLALRRTELPTGACRPVLLALSAGDQRRQRALDAGAHLLSCPTCAELSEPLLARKRALAAVLPAGALSWAAGLKPAGLSGSSVAQLAAGTAAAGAAGATVFVLATADGSQPAPAPAEPPPVVGAAHPEVTRAELAAAAQDSRAIRADAATVLAVGADEGFWIANDGQRLWVQLTGPGESGFEVRAGQRLSFSAQPVAHRAGFSRRVGLTAPEGARELDRQGVHLRVPVAGLTRAAAATVRETREADPESSQGR